MKSMCMHLEMVGGRHFNKLWRVWFEQPCVNIHDDINSSICPELSVPSDVLNPLSHPAATGHVCQFSFKLIKIKYK